MSATIKLKGRDVALAWTNRAQCRLGSLPRVPDLSNPEQAYSGICAWAWAMLPRNIASRYPTYEDIAEDITEENMVEISEAISAALEEADQGEEGSVKNASSGKGRKSASKPG